MSNRLVQDATAVLNKNAVQFDSHRRYNNQAAWPFWYPLIPKPYLETDVLHAGLGLLGHSLPGNTRKEINVQLDRDSVYRLINLKYTALSPGRASTLAGTITIVAGAVAVVGVGTAFTTDFIVGQPMTWADDGGVNRFGVIKTITDATNLTLELAQQTDTTGNTYGPTQFTTSVSPNTPVPFNLYESQQLVVTRFLRVSVIMSSLGTKYLMGGTQVFTDPDTNNSGLQERPILMTALQGFDDGLGQLRTPALFGYDSSVKIIIENNLDSEIIVNGTLFGYKISPGEL